MSIETESKNEAELIEVEPHQKILYDGRVFFVPGDRGELVPMNEGSVKRYLAGCGYEKSKNADTINPALTEIQIANYALRIGDVAGHAAGWHNCPEGRFYVPRPPMPVNPQPVAFGMIERLLREMLGDDQLGWLLRWIAIGHRSLMSGHYRPGQAVALVGPRNGGKTLVSGIIGEIFGGRTAHPFLTWAGAKSFNYHLAGAETLIIDDESPSRDMRSRRNLAVAIKANLFGGSVPIERKYGDPFTARPWWRVLICCNESPEDVMVLPPLDDSMMDKIALLSVARPTFPNGLDTDAGRNEFRRRISQELPGLLHHALSLPIAPFAVNDRTGIDAIHHPKILELLRELSKEAQLEHLILCAKDDFAPTWTGTTNDFFHKITGPEVFQSTREGARRLLESPHVAAYLLRDLARSRPALVSSSTGHGNVTNWTITPANG